MNDGMTTRRTLVGRALLLFGAAGTAAAVDRGAVAARRSRPGLSFEARHIELRDEDVRTAALFDEHGRRAGALFTLAHAPAPVLHPDEFGVAHVEEHTLRLADGTVFARATADAGVSEGAILGGTGAYAKAHGAIRIQIAPGGTQVHVTFTD